MEGEKRVLGRVASVLGKPKSQSSLGTVACEIQQALCATTAASYNVPLCTQDCRSRRHFTSTRWKTANVIRYSDFQFPEAS